MADVLRRDRSPAARELRMAVILAGINLALTAVIAVVAFTR